MRCFLAVALLLFAGCSQRLEALKARPLDGGDFNSALAVEYLAFAQSEYDQGHIFSAEHFAGKGLAAALGQKVELEVSDAFIEDSVKSELFAARQLLLSTLNGDVKNALPEEAARVQLLFDCWQHLRGSGQQRAPCGEEFWAVLAQLQNSAEAMGIAREAIYQVPFAAGANALGVKGESVVRRIAKNAPWRSDYHITLSGADERRLQTVRDALAAHGVIPNRIRFSLPNDTQAVHLSNDEDVQEPTTGDRVKVTLVRFIKAPKH